MLERPSGTEALCVAGMRRCWTGGAAGHLILSQMSLQWSWKPGESHTVTERCLVHLSEIKTSVTKHLVVDALGMKTGWRHYFARAPPLHTGLCAAQDDCDWFKKNSKHFLPLYWNDNGCSQIFLQRWYSNVDLGLVMRDYVQAKKQNQDKYIWQ